MRERGLCAARRRRDIGRDIRRRGLLALLVVLTACGVAGAQSGQPPQKPLRVATRVVPPFVFERGGRLDGFSVDLWNSIAQRTGLKGEMTVNPSVKDLLAAVKANRADVGIAAISITSERESVFDFSHPMFDSGLQILVRDQTGGGNSMPGIVSILFSRATLELAGIIFLMVLVPAHLIWFIERRHEEGMIAHKPYIPGIFHAFWWAAGTLGAQADEMPRSGVGRFIAVVWMFTSIIFVAHFTATITASLTVQQLQGDIQGPDDLPRKRVATTTGSTSASFLRERKVRVTEFPQIEGAYEALRNRQVDAVVFDAPVLQYYAAHEGKGKVQVVGSIFREESYGIVFPASSPLRKRVNNALLSMHEDGTYRILHDKWFRGE